MKVVKGDLIKKALDGEFDVIIHGCNCMNTMGAGIAKQIREQLPQAYVADCGTMKGDSDKLGTYSSVEIGPLTIVNAYTQYDYRSYPPPVDYNAIQKVFEKIAQDFHDARIGYPKIGAGLAGGDWEIISAIIDDALGDIDHTLVEYTN